MRQSYFYLVGICIGWLFFPATCYAQQADSTIYYQMRPKIARYALTTVRDFKVLATSDLSGDAEGDIQQNLRRDAFIRFPLIMKDDLLVGLGLVYRHEKFSFDNIQQIDYPFFDRLEDKGLRRTGLDVFYQKKYSKQRRLKGNVSFRLNGDSYQLENLHRFLKVSLVVVYTKQKSPQTEIGWGIVAGYDLGRPLVYPMFSYKHYFNQHFSVDLSLPKEANLIYAFDPKTFLTFTTEISGASYHIEDPLIQDFERLEIRKSELRAKLRLDREIYDWLWVGVEAGGLRYLNFAVADRKNLRDETLINVNPATAQFFNFSLFIVPPRKMYQNIK